MLSTHQSNHGFTLIELIIVTTVGVLLLSGSVAAYNTFFRRQTTVTSGQDVLTILHQAQSRARSGDKPSDDCTNFQGYRVSASQNQSSFVLQTLCDDSAAESVTYQLKSGDVFANSFSLVFPPLPGAVAASDITIRIKPVGTAGNPPIPRYEVTVSRQGVIGEGVYVTQ